jgi:hypothetical protein
MTKKINIQEIAKMIGEPPLICHALICSGLLGYTDGGNLSPESIKHYKQYLTQWRNDLPPRCCPMDRLPPIKGLAGGEQPASTPTVLVAAPEVDPLKAAEGDVGWIAHFYLRPNPFFFPNPTNTTLIGPIPIKLKKRLRVIFSGLPINICPDPEGRLALIVVEGMAGTEDDSFEVAYEAALSILREVAFAADVPLPIAHSLMIGVPSGVIRLQFPKPSKEVEFESLKIRFSESLSVELEEARSLYWEALSTSNPFHQFLSFWRIYERVISARWEWRKAKKRADTKVVEEKMPNFWAWSKYSGMSFEQVRQKLAGPYRDALAHADAKRNRPRTPLKASDVSDVAAQLPTVRFIARTVVQNLEATLTSKGE